MKIFNKITAGALSLIIAFMFCSCSANTIEVNLEQNSNSYIQNEDCYFGGDDIMIFKEVIAGELIESDGAKGYYVLDKSQLTSDNKQFIDME